MQNLTPRRSNKFGSANNSFVQSHVMEAFAEKVRLLDTTRWIILYIRKSNKAGKAEHGNFLIEQEKVLELLLKAGIPRERILVLDGDTGKSAKLNAKFRKDLDKMMGLLLEEQVGGVIALNIARLFRDRTLQAPSSFAGRMQRSKALLITADGGEWVKKDLNYSSDLKWFLDKAGAAAAELDDIRERTMVSRRNSVFGDDLTNFSGASAPIGYAVKPGYKTYIGSELVSYSPRLYVYNPHAEYKIGVMRVSMLPHIDTFPKLQRHLRDNNLMIPPFDPQIVADTFSRSSLCKVSEGRGKGKIKLPSDASFLPSAHMLRQILLEPLAVGDRFYGSGDDGKYLKRKYEKIAKIMGQSDDSKMNIERIFVGNVPELAICNTPELEQLYYDVWDKWSPWDVRTARASDYEEMVPNEARAVRPASSGRAPDPENFNPWVSKVWCLKHGEDEDSEPVFDHPMVRNGRGWTCMKDNLKALIDGVCSNWGCNDILTKVLDAHLRLTIRMILDGKKALVENLVEARDADKAQLQSLHETVKELEADLMNAQASATAQRKAMQKAEIEDYEEQIDEYLARHMVPVAKNLATAKRDLELLRARLDQVEASNSRHEVMDMLSKYLTVACPTNAQQMEIVAHMVKSVGVLVSDGFNTRAVYVRFAWMNGEVDDLVSWRESSRDDRPWTEAEDAVLDTCWADKSLSWLDIRGQLQPFRKFSSAHRRADAQGLTSKIRRTAAWTDAARASDRNFADNNPDLLYLWLLQDPDEGTEVCRMIHQSAFDLEAALTMHDFPEEVSDSLQVLFAEMCPASRQCTDTGRTVGTCPEWRAAPGAVSGPR